MLELLRALRSVHRLSPPSLIHLLCSPFFGMLYNLELTVPFETNTSSARLRKSNRYASLFTDLRLSAYQAKFFSLEVGSRGFLSPSNFETLLSLSLLPSKSPVTARRLRSDLSRLATLCSYAIFRSRSDPSWLTPPLLTIHSSDQSI